MFQAVGALGTTALPDAVRGARTVSRVRQARCASGRGPITRDWLDVSLGLSLVITTTTREIIVRQARRTLEVSDNLAGLGPSYITRTDYPR